MAKRRLKKSVYPIIYGAVIVLTVGFIYVIEGAVSKSNFKVLDDYTYVSKTIFDNILPVVNQKKIKIIKPFLDDDINILKTYYNYQAQEDEQKQALILFENTYLQSSGISYGKKEKFDVISILDGTVIDVKEDNTLGVVVQIRHNNELISVYQSLSEVVVKKDDIVTQGQIIGKSGLSNISTSLGNHLHFEIISKGKTVNPNDCYDKKEDEL